MFTVIPVSALIYTCFLNLDSCLFDSWVSVSTCPAYFCKSRYLFSCWVFVNYFWVLVLYMLNVILTSRLRLWFVFSVFGSPLDLTCRDSDPCLYLTLISACSLMNPLFHSHFHVHLGPSPHIPFTVHNRVHVSDSVNPITCILCCVMCVLWMILYFISLRFLFLDILNILFQILFQKWLLWMSGCLFPICLLKYDVNWYSQWIWVYTVLSGLFDLAILLMLSNSGGCSRCVLELPIFCLDWMF